ncbi:MAG TPA: tRNA (guanosine(46)-N7)-methyltransferase TrmB [Gammaproteobacteria bacterium]|nr:tRNA (guanosine(46)-N7)-methyltransferase TrmB [Gammaproteobacteria bacterium]
MNEERHHRTIQSFVRREGRITRGQQRALDQLWPLYGITPGSPVDLDALFGRTAPRTLEIGFGNGEALAEIAAQQPEHDFIGIEVHRPGVGHLLQLLEKRGISNVHIYNTDAVKVLTDCIPDNSLDRLLLFFPDPWHKKRHHKRRIVQPAFVELIARKLRPGGIFHMATDWQDYAEHALAVLQASASFRNCAGDGNYSAKPEYRPLTKFEQRGQRLGHIVRDLLFERRQADE